MEEEEEEEERREAVEQKTKLTRSKILPLLLVSQSLPIIGHKFIRQKSDSGNLFSLCWTGREAEDEGTGGAVGGQ